MRFIKATIRIFQTFIAAGMMAVLRIFGALFAFLTLGAILGSLAIGVFFVP